MARLTKREGARYPVVRERPRGPLAIRDEINRFFDEILGLEQPFFPAMRSAPIMEFMPNVDLTDTDGALKVTAELPGMTENDFDVELDEDTLVITGEKKREEAGEEGDRTWRETSYGRFQRQIPLPCKVESGKATASFRNGTLRIVLPKSEEAKAKRRSIKVSAG